MALAFAMVQCVQSDRSSTGLADTTGLIDWFDRLCDCGYTPNEKHRVCKPLMVKLLKSIVFSCLHSQVWLERCALFIISSVGTSIFDAGFALGAMAPIGGPGGTFPPISGSSAGCGVPFGGNWSADAFAWDFVATGHKVSINIRPPRPPAPPELNLNMRFVKQ
jgi:hypothetical protein